MKTLARTILGLCLLASSGCVLWADTRTQVTPDPCLAKMETAMKAMEPFAIAMKNPPQDLKEFNAAVELWNITKRECWTQP